MTLWLLHPHHCSTLEMIAVLLLSLWNGVCFAHNISIINR